MWNAITSFCSILFCYALKRFNWTLKLKREAAIRIYIFLFFFIIFLYTNKSNQERRFALQKSILKNIRKKNKRRKRMGTMNRESCKRENLCRILAFKINEKQKKNIKKVK